MAHSKEPSTLACSFCEKGAREVRKLIVGPTVYICDECVVPCSDIIEPDDAEAPALAGFKQMSLLVFLREYMQGKSVDSITVDELRNAIAVEHVRHLPKPPHGHKRRVASPADLDLERLAHRFNIPAIRLEGHDIDPNAVALLTRELCERHRVFPVSVGSGKLLLAMVDPSDIAAIDDVKFATDRDVVGVAAAEVDLLAAIERHFPRPH